MRIFLKYLESRIQARIMQKNEHSYDNNMQHYDARSYEFILFSETNVYEYILHMIDNMAA